MSQAAAILGKGTEDQAIAVFEKDTLNLVMAALC